MMLSFYIVVVSDQVFSGKKKDVSGEKACTIIESKGYVVRGKEVIPNNPREIIRVLRNVRDVNTIVFIGGTGYSPRDITIDVIEQLAWRKVSGFGELFRFESFKEIGYRGLLSRAETYVLSDGRIVVVLPGSPNAVSLGLEILLEMIEHLFEEVHRFDKPHK